MDYPSAKFGDFNFSRFCFVVQTTDTHTHITDAAKRFTLANVVGVSNKRAVIIRSRRRLLVKERRVVVMLASLVMNGMAIPSNMLVTKTTHVATFIHCLSVCLSRTSF